MPESGTAQFNTLVRPHLETLYRVAYRLVRNRADAQDLVQDTCVAACRNLKELAATDAPLRWLLRVQHNRFIDGARRRKNSPVVEVEGAVDEARWISELPDPEQLLQQSHNEQLLERALLLLDEMQRTLLGLRIEGYDLSEIEAITGIDRNLLRKRLYRARLCLARRLTEQTEDAENGRRTGSKP